MKQATAVNAAVNEAAEAVRGPRPATASRLNKQAQEWWSSFGTNHWQQSKDRASTTTLALEVPTNWPHDVVFLTQNLVAASVPEPIALRYVLEPSTAASPNEEEDAGPSQPNRLAQATHRDGKPVVLYTTSIQQQVPLVILPIDESSPWCPESFHSTSRNLKCHPSAGSFGLFAAQDIPHNTFIRPYLGVLHTKRDADFHSTYDLSLCHDPRLADHLQRSPSKKKSIDAEALSTQLETVSLADVPGEHDVTALYVDSRFWGNESRFVNDYRGIAAKANVEFRSFIQPSGVPSDEPHHDAHRFQMGLFSTRPIRKGQELVINYGKSYWIHHDQLTQLQASKSKTNSSPPPADLQPNPPPVKLDPLQAMLQRSRLRVSRTAVHPHRPAQAPPPPPTSSSSSQS